MTSLDAGVSRLSSANLVVIRSLGPSRKASVKSELRAQGWASFSVTTSKSASSMGFVRSSPETDIARAELTDAFENLPPDPAAPEVRERRLGTFILMPWLDGGALIAKPQSRYYQSAKYNPELGGLVREFGSLSPELARNPFLTGVVWEAYSQLPYSTQPDLQLDLRVQVHLIRLLATPGNPGTAVPNCLHRDGEPYTFIILAGRYGVQGGDTRISRDQAGDRMLLETTLRDPFSGVVVDDERVYHEVTPVCVQPDTLQGNRDSLLIDFTPLLPALS